MKALNSNYELFKLIPTQDGFNPDSFIIQKIFTQIESPNEDQLKDWVKRSEEYINKYTILEVYNPIYRPD